MTYVSKKGVLMPNFLVKLFSRTKKTNLLEIPEIEFYRTSDAGHDANPSSEIKVNTTETLGTFGNAAGISSSTYKGMRKGGAPMVLDSATVHYARHPDTGGLTHVAVALADGAGGHRTPDEDELIAATSHTACQASVQGMSKYNNPDDLIRALPSIIDSEVNPKARKAGLNSQYCTIVAAMSFETKSGQRLIGYSLGDAMMVSWNPKTGTLRNILPAECIGGSPKGVGNCGTSSKDARMVDITLEDGEMLIPMCDGVWEHLPLGPDEEQGNGVVIRRLDETKMSSILSELGKTATPADIVNHIKAWSTKDTDLERKDKIKEAQTLLEVFDIRYGRRYEQLERLLFKVNSETKALEPIENYNNNLMIEYEQLKGYVKAPDLMSKLSHIRDSSCILDGKQYSFFQDADREQAHFLIRKMNVGDDFTMTVVPLPDRAQEKLRASALKAYMVSDEDEKKGLESENTFIQQELLYHRRLIDRVDNEITSIYVAVNHLNREIDSYLAQNDIDIDKIERKINDIRALESRLDELEDISDFHSALTEDMKVTLLKIPAAREAIRTQDSALTEAAGLKAKTVLNSKIAKLDAAIKELKTPFENVNALKEMLASIKEQHQKAANVYSNQDWSRTQATLEQCDAKLQLILNRYSPQQAFIQSQLESISNIKKLAQHAKTEENKTHWIQALSKIENDVKSKLSNENSYEQSVKDMFLREIEDVRAILNKEMLHSELEQFDILAREQKKLFKIDGSDLSPVEIEAYLIKVSKLRQAWIAFDKYQKAALNDSGFPNHAAGLSSSIQAKINEITVVFDTFKSKNDQFNQQLDALNYSGDRNIHKKVILMILQQDMLDALEKAKGDGRQMTILLERGKILQALLPNDKKFSNKIMQYELAVGMEKVEAMSALLSLSKEMSEILSSPVAYHAVNKLEPSIRALENAGLHGRALEKLAEIKSEYSFIKSEDYRKMDRLAYQIKQLKRDVVKMAAQEDVRSILSGDHAIALLNQLSTLEFCTQYNDRMALGFQLSDIEALKAANLERQAEIESLKSELTYFNVLQLEFEGEDDFEKLHKIKQDYDALKPNFIEKLNQYNELEEVNQKLSELTAFEAKLTTRMTEKHSEIQGNKRAQAQLDDAKKLELREQFARFDSDVETSKSIMIHLHEWIKQEIKDGKEINLTQAYDELKNLLSETYERNIVAYQEGDLKLTEIDAKIKTYETLMLVIDDLQQVAMDSQAQNSYILSEFKEEVSYLLELSNKNHGKNMQSPRQGDVFWYLDAQVSLTALYREAIAKVPDNAGKSFLIKAIRSSYEDNLKQIQEQAKAFSKKLDYPKVDIEKLKTEVDKRAYLAGFSKESLNYPLYDGQTLIQWAIAHKDNTMLSALIASSDVKIDRASLELIVEGIQSENIKIALIRSDIYKRFERDSEFDNHIKQRLTGDTDLERLSHALKERDHLQVFCVLKDILYSDDAMKIIADFKKECKDYYLNQTVQQALEANSGIMAALNDKARSLVQLREPLHTLVSSDTRFMRWLQHEDGAGVSTALKKQFDEFRWELLRAAAPELKDRIENLGHTDIRSASDLEFIIRELDAESNTIFINIKRAIELIPDDLKEPAATKKKASESSQPNLRQEILNLQGLIKKYEQKIEAEKSGLKSLMEANVPDEAKMAQLKRQIADHEFHLDQLNSFYLKTDKAISRIDERLGKVSDASMTLSDFSKMMFTKGSPPTGFLVGDSVYMRDFILGNPAVLGVIQKHEGMLKQLDEQYQNDMTLEVSAVSRAAATQKMQSDKMEAKSKQKTADKPIVTWLPSMADTQVLKEISKRAINIHSWLETAFQRAFDLKKELTNGSQEQADLDKHILRIVDIEMHAKHGMVVISSTDLEALDNEYAQLEKRAGELKKADQPLTARDVKVYLEQMEKEYRTFLSTPLEIKMEKYAESKMKAEVNAVSAWLSTVQHYRSQLEEIEQKYGSIIAHSDAETVVKRLKSEIDHRIDEVSRDLNLMADPVSILDRLPDKYSDLKPEMRILSEYRKAAQQVLNNQKSYPKEVVDHCKIISTAYEQALYAGLVNHLDNPEKARLEFSNRFEKAQRYYENAMSEIFPYVGRSDFHREIIALNQPNLLQKIDFVEQHIQSDPKFNDPQLLKAYEALKDPEQRDKDFISFFEIAFDAHQVKLVEQLDTRIKAEYQKAINFLNIKSNSHPVETQRLLDKLMEMREKDISALKSPILPMQPKAILQDVEKRIKIIEKKAEQIVKKPPAKPVLPSYRSQNPLRRLKDEAGLQSKPKPSNQGIKKGPGPSKLK